MLSSTSRSTLPVYASLLLAYAIVISLLAPFTTPRVAAASTEPRSTKIGLPVGAAIMTSQNSGRREGEVLVRFRSEASEGDKDSLALSHGARRTKKLRGESGVEKLELSAGQDPQAAAAQLRLNPAVEFVEPNFLIAQDQIKPLSTSGGVTGASALFDNLATSASQPGVNPQNANFGYSNSTTGPNFLNPQGEPATNDPRFSEQWALRNTGQVGGSFGSDIGVVAAWQKTAGSQATIVAIIDSGVDFTHPDLSNNQWNNPSESINGRDDDRDGFVDDAHGWDWVESNGAGSNAIKDEQGHGTAIAGIIAAQGNNAIGVSGVMWRAGLMSLRVLDSTGTGDVGNAVEAIDYALSHGAQVINLSWGTSSQSIALKDAIDRAIRSGVVVVCSAGNSGQNLEVAPYYPASFSSRDLISVASSDSFDQPTAWSNWSSRQVTIAAPGASILTTRMGGGYWTVTGTSASAPLVSGVAGLIKTVLPSLKPQSVVKAITNSARQNASLLGKVASGGVVNASGALDALHGFANPLPSPSSGSNGNGQPRHSPSPPPGMTGHPNPKNELDRPAPPATKGAPRKNLPNLDELRKLKPTEPKAKAPIESNLMCADCDPYNGGGGGSYYPTGDPNFSNARTLPGNETGQPGVDLGSQNFNWSTSLVSLPGRAGLDLNLSLFYNSLVWTKDGSYIKYNADLGSPAPGFRLGFPTLQQRFTDSQSGSYSYVMVTASGGRVEMRQVGSSNVYESQDGSFTQVDVSNSSAPIVRTSDGTQLTFAPVAINSEYRCTMIKDRNGNYLSAAYDSTNGHLQTVTDTLGRVVSFVYDGSNNLQAIRQTWAGVAHDWATFYYDQVYVAPAFGGGLLVNGPNNVNVPVLKEVWLHDGSHFSFEYNSAFGQVNRINRYAQNLDLLSYTSYNLNSSTGQTDCPRFTQRKDWADDWNGELEAVTNYSVAGDKSWSQQTTPDGTIYKEFYYTSGWRTGLTSSTEVWANSVRQKWIEMTWTQDDTNLSYSKNPRLSETNVWDVSGNRRRSTIDYHSSFNLPLCITEYGADATTAIRFTVHHYRFDAAYVDRRIIGLPESDWVFDGSWNLYSRVHYDYDWSGQLEALPNGAAAVHHDNSNYGTNFVYGRGNLSAVTRLDVTDPDNSSKNVVNKFGHNITGSLTFTRDMLWHQTFYSYADSFSDPSLNSTGTFAYPTTISDSDWNPTYIRYNFDFGAKTRHKGPAAAGQANAVYLFEYDSAMRLQKAITEDAIGTDDAYTEWVYAPTMKSVVQKSMILNSSLADANQRSVSTTTLDGASHVVGTSSDLPSSTGGYTGQSFNYDNMGRLIQHTNPAEMTGTWVATGDDNAGWRWTEQTYDWKGRPRQTTNPDGSTREIIYGGCGCAGGEVVTGRDERGRTTRTTKDVFGRLSKTEELNWDQTVYSTTNYTYNVRDQITSITQQNDRVRSFGYDGHGRLASKTTPEQGTVTYSHFADDQLQTVTDARGATTTFSYNTRQLVSGVTFGAPSGVAATPNIGFLYDAAGNRTSMTDGLGSVSYAYTKFSQLASETRTFSGVGSYSLSYQYNLGGEMTSITNPSGSQVTYNYDKIGRLASMTGAGPVSASTYVSSIGYRAFGAAKQVSYGNGRTLSLSYNNRMWLAGWDLANPGGGSNSANALGYTYSYNQYGEGNTGRPDFANSLYDSTLDRAWTYDQVGRLTSAYTGKEANADWSGPDGPYAQSYSHDIWGNITNRAGWGGANPSYSVTFNSNNRRAGSSYDAAGSLTNDGLQSFTYDASGQQATATMLQSGYASSFGYDGDRARGKKTEGVNTTYYIRSSALGGQVVAELSGNGTWTRGYVYVGGQLLAIQYNNSVNWVHQEPFTKGQRLSDSSGALIAGVEMDPMGGETSRSWNSSSQPHKYTSYERDANQSDDAMHRRYDSWWSRFDQPDPYDGSYDYTDPQSLNRYSYVKNDPVNAVDPSGLMCFDIIRTDFYSDTGQVIGSYVVGMVCGRDGEGHARVGDSRARGGSRGGATGGQRQPYVDQTALNECISEMFGVKLSSFTESRDGSNGSFTGYGPDSLSNKGNLSTIHVVNEVNAYTSGQLKRQFNAILTPGQSPLGKNSFVYGLTLPPKDIHGKEHSAYRNFTSSNVRDPMEIIKTQVHELGHSLQFIVGTAYKGDHGGSDLEDCVDRKGGFKS